MVAHPAGPFEDTSSTYVRHLIVAVAPRAIDVVVASWVSAKDGILVIGAPPLLEQFGVPTLHSIRMGIDLEAEIVFCVSSTFLYLPGPVT